MAELADALDLGSSGAIHAGSIPVTCTIDESVRTIRTLNILSVSNMTDFILHKNPHR